MGLSAIISLRPQEPDGAFWASLAEEYSMGFAHMPIMDEQALPLDADAFSDVDGFVVSSPAVVRLHGKNLKNLLNGRPVHVVGARTANLLERLGCKLGLTAKDGSRLQEQLRGHPGRLCFLSGQEVRVDFASLPDNGVAKRVICYDMIRREWDAETQAACFKPGNVLLVTSGRIADAISEVGQGHHSLSIHAACMSLAVADRLALPLGHILVAKNPDIESLSDIVRHFLSKKPNRA